MTAIDTLRDDIRSMLRSHPLLSELPPYTVKATDTQKIERYAIGASNGIGHGFQPTTTQRLWVLASSVDLSRLPGIIPVRRKGYSAGEKPGRNSNLEQIPGFRYSELLRFSPKNLEEAEQILAEVLR